MPSLGPRVEPQIEAEPLHLGRADHGRLVSHAEFASAFYDEPWKYERVDGRLVVMSPDGWQHVEVSEPWRDHLVVYKLAHPDVVRRVVSQPWCRIDDDNDRIGDIGVYLVGNAGQIPDAVPDLMLEFVSKSRKDKQRDYVAKRAEYERLGVREYVIVDRFRRQVTVLTLEAGQYVERVIPADGTYHSPLLPGLAIELVGIWPG